ncbi:MAG: DUF1905 domain-containing protein [Ilumatobacteraceae bacterium]
MTLDGPAPDRYEFDAEVWEHSGNGSWHFVSLPDDIADEIEERCGARAGGFGSVRVEVTVGSTTWSTSVFPDSKRSTYILPVKAAVRKAEGLHDGAIARFELRTLV